MIMGILRLSLLIFMLFAVAYTVEAKNIIYEKSDSLIYQSYIDQFAEQHDKPLNELLINTAKYFLGKPYVASTLEVLETEKLIINLREFDCTTFVENCIALSLVIKSKNTTFENYCQQLITIRYRKGTIEGYTSRLHYTTDWIYENAKNGTIEDISSAIGGINIDKTIDFMTTHSQLYKHLANNRVSINELKKIENEINNRKNYIILAKVGIKRNEKSIHNGDIIAFSTSVQGLDYSHIGIAYWQEGNLHFIHASSKVKKVVIEEKSLSEYCKDSKICTGISILRLTEN